MDASLLRHQSDSRYCFSIDTTHALIRLALSRLANVDKVELVYGDPRSFHQKHSYKPLTLKYQDHSFSYYETVIELYPMRLMYVFYIEENGEKYYFSESGLSEKYIFDLAFISAFQFIGENIKDVVKENESWKGRVIYQIFPERFNRSNKLDKSYVNVDWYYKDLRNHRGAMLGGDLYGVIDKLDYLKDLGIGAIYLTPIHPSPSSHKYDVLDYYDVDHHFGGKEAFKELVTKAHEKDIKIMMDMVFNHMSNQNPIFLDVCEKGGNSKYYDWFFINGSYPSKYPLNYLCFGNFGHMPKINTNNIEVQNYLLDVTRYWIKEFDIDGYRLDVSEGVSHDFWMKFKLVTKEVKQDVLVIGENWFNSESYLGNNQFDGVMNYPFLGAVSGYICKKTDARETAEAFDGLLMRYKDGHNRMMMNILASHDIQRFYNLCDKNKDLSLLGHAIMMFYLGYPLLYYGEEIFMEGGGDPDNRRGMEWNSGYFYSPEHALFKEIIRLRNRPTLKEGDISIYSEEGLLIIRRTLGHSGLALISNMTNNKIKRSGKIILKNKYSLDGEIEPNGFIITEFYN